MAKSTWQPPKSSNPIIEAYILNTRTELPLLKTTRPTQNLSPLERQALKDLRERKTLTIKKADKGTSIVVEDTTSYISTGKQHLTDPKIYSPLDADPTQAVTEQINSFLQHLEQAISIQPPENLLNHPT